MANVQEPEETPIPKRHQLHEILKGFVPGGHAYFQPPDNLNMEFPCIIYKRDYVKTEYADNSPYKHKTRYQVTIVDKDPDSEIPAKVAAMRYSAFDRFYISGNLNHDVYNVYF